MKEIADKPYRLTLRKAVTAASAWQASRSPEAHRAIKTRRQAILRRLRRKITKAERKSLTYEVELLAVAETQFFGVKHRDTTLPRGPDGKPYVPKTSGGRLHVPVAALPLNARGRRHIPSPRDIVANVVFEKFINKGNLAMALAKLAAICPEKYRAEVLKMAVSNTQVRRALNRVGHDVLLEWPPRKDEMLILENFYATTLFHRPLKGVAPDVAVWMIVRKTGVELSVDRYRRILRKFFVR